MGERLESIGPPAERFGILVWPGVSVDTAWAYHAWDEAGAGPVPAELGSNAFEPIVFDRHPSVRQSAGALAAGQASVVALSGSGSAVYALYADAAIRDGDLARLRPRLASISPAARAWAFAAVDHSVRPRPAGVAEGFDPPQAV